MKTGTIYTAIAIGAFLVVAVVCGGSSFVFYQLVQQELLFAEGLGPSVSYGPNTNTVTDINYQLTGPNEVRLGEPARFLVEVTNTSTTATRELYSLDLYTELVDQGPFHATPAASSTHHTRGGEYAELLYQKSLPPGATERIEVVFTPTQTGTYYVNIDVCIDTQLDFIERFHTLTVRPAEQSSSTP